jgi:DNA-binding transcriptional ArsR family regulator
MRELIAITKALADESRLRAIGLLKHQELCLCQIVEVLGLASSTVSRHMSILQQVGSSSRGRKDAGHTFGLQREIWRRSSTTLWRWFLPVLATKNKPRLTRSLSRLSSRLNRRNFAVGRANANVELCCITTRHVGEYKLWMTSHLSRSAAQIAG